MKIGTIIYITNGINIGIAKKKYIKSGINDIGQIIMMNGTQT